jgi:hypothetical protein
MRKRCCTQWQLGEHESCVDVPEAEGAPGRCLWSYQLLCALLVVTYQTSAPRICGLCPWNVVLLAKLVSARLVR